MFKNIHRCGYEVNSENKINLDDLISGNIFRKLKSSCLPCHIIVGGKKDLLSFVGYLITATSVPRWSHRQMIFIFVIGMLAILVDRNSWYMKNAFYSIL